MKISPARKSAFEILLKIEKEKAFSSILLPVYEENLSPKDRSLCHEITLGVLRNKIYLDYLVQKLTKKKLDKFDTEVINALRIGIYQMLFLDKIPAYSAINESVNLVKFARKKSASGLVNAVLRRVLKEKFAFDFENETEKLSVETSHPVWLIEKWIKEFGFEKTKKIAVSNNKTQQTAFRLTEKFFKEDKAKRSEILGKLTQNFTENDIYKYSYTAEFINDELRDWAERGFIYFQDFGSQIVAQAAKVKVGQKFLDLCASPGSKTTLIAANIFRKNLPAQIFAGDLYSHRVNFLKENCQKQSVDSVNIIRYDAEKSLPFAENSFDKILIDAPCSGTGTLRHNPEIRYFLEPEDFLSLHNKQLRILHNASKLVKEGGEIIYSTCSLEVEENEKIIANFLFENNSFEKIIPAIPENFLTGDNFGRIFPHRDNTDGFFIASLVRK